jgi:integrase
VARGEVVVNPTTGLELPVPQGRRERIADPAEAGELVAALKPDDRGLWGCAFHAGLRAGEIQALDWSCVDLAGGTIRVERSYDPKSRQFIEPKSRKGRRKVGIVPELRDLLVEHRMRTGRTEGLVFGRDGEHPFTSSNVWRRAHTAWKRANKTRAEQQLAQLEPIGLHEARHSFASTLIAADVNIKAVSELMGHSSITITLDRYGHMLPGSVEEATLLHAAFLERANTNAEPAHVALAVP